MKRLEQVIRRIIRLTQTLAGRLERADWIFLSILIASGLGVAITISGGAS